MSKSASKMKISVFAMAMVLSVGVPLKTLAHGEDKPGPMGGEVRMPGAFHTEVKLEGRVFKVYLTDVQFKNPTVDNSSVKAALRDGKSSTSLTCVATKEAFECEVPKDVSVEKGDLVVTATRAGMKGNEAVYKLPLFSGHKKSGADGKGAGHSGMHH